MKIRLFTLLLSLFALQTAIAQEFDVPEDYVLEKASDYEKYKDDVLAAISWMKETPYNTEQKKRKEVDKFLIEWISGSPDVSVELNAKTLNFVKENPELLVLFMAGWTEYAINHEETAKKIDCVYAALETVIKFYKKNEAYLEKDKAMVKLIKTYDNGELRSYAEKNS